MSGHSFGLQTAPLDHSMSMAHLTFTLVEREGARKTCDTVCYTLLAREYHSILVTAQVSLKRAPLNNTKTENKIT